MDDNKNPVPEQAQNSDDQLPEEVNKPDVVATNDPQLPRWLKFKRWYLNHKRFSIPLSVLVFMLLLVGIPYSRYALAGLIVRNNIAVTVLDSKTGGAVSEAQVKSSGGKSGITNGSGYVVLSKLKPGPVNITITKKYYKDGHIKSTIGVLGSSKKLQVHMQATGRQVKIITTNVITAKPLADVGVKIDDVSVKTDSAGTATAVLPVGSTTKKATLQLSGYNDASVTVQISDSQIKENRFSLTPSGKIYFLTNRTGKVDVMKTNLDGSDQQVVLAGTGSEDTNNTILIASSDWKYLALLAKREPNKPKVYIISTNDDQVTTADEGSANFSLAGWVGESLIYTVSRTDLSPWSTGSSKLKAYNADTGKLTLLDQTTGTGISTSNAYEYYELVYIAKDKIVYGKSWTSQNTANADYSGKQQTLSIISANGQDHSVVAQYDAAANYLYYTPHAPNSIYILQNTQGQSKYSYFDYMVGAQPKQVSLTDEQVYKRYPNYYLSPDGNRALWGEQRDSQVLLVGDDSGNNGKVVIDSGKYIPVGWFSNDYLLTAKDNGELDIVGSSGGTPLKVTNYLSTTYYSVAPYGYVGY